MSVNSIVRTVLTQIGYSLFQQRWIVVKFPDGSITQPTQQPAYTASLMIVIDGQAFPGFRLATNRAPIVLSSGEIFVLIQSDSEHSHQCVIGYAPSNLFVTCVFLHIALLLRAIGWGVLSIVLTTPENLVSVLLFVLFSASTATRRFLVVSRVSPFTVPTTAPQPIGMRVVFPEILAGLYQLASGALFLKGDYLRHAFTFQALGTMTLPTSCIKPTRLTAVFGEIGRRLPLSAGSTAKLRYNGGSHVVQVAP